MKFLDRRGGLRIGLLTLFCIATNLSRINALDLLPAEEESLNFLVIGDWGGLPVSPYTTEIEKAIAREMGKFATANNVQFLLALGDNFYYDGVKNVEDPRFQETYENVFSEKSLEIDWYFVAGNHDHNGNVTAQIEFSTWEKRWNFPDFYYRIPFTIPSSQTTIDVLMIDTVLLCGNSDSDWLHLQPLGPDNGPIAEKQWEWIEQQLNTSKADYLLVAGHYPVYSIGEHGPTKCLVNRLQPLLHKYSVTAYFCGHDHDLQHLEYTDLDHTVEYFLSGAANFVENSDAHKSYVPPGSSKFFWADLTSFGGYGFVQISKSQMLFTFYDASGQILYKKIVSPRRL